MSKGRILHADDEMGSRLLLAKCLQRVGYEVASKSDGEKAFNLFQENPDYFNLVITDKQMPRDQDGILFCKNVKALSPATPVILVCASVTKAEEEGDLGLIFDGFSGKPVNFSHLLSVIARFI